MKPAFWKEREETRCLTFGSPPACYLRGEVRRDGNGRAKIFNCSFLILSWLIFITD
jgi:hypothetical protein